MNIRKKLNGLVILIILSIIFSFVIYYLLTAPVKRMRVEEELFITLEESLTEEIIVLGELFTGIVKKEYTHYQDRVEITHNSFNNIRRKSVLSEQSERVRDAIEIISNLEKLLIDKRLSLDEHINQVLQDAHDVYNLDNNIRLITYINSKQLANSVNMKVYRENLSDLFSSIFYIYNNLKDSIDVLEAQYEVIDSAVNRIKMRSQIISILFSIIMTITGIVISFTVTNRISQRLIHIDENIYHLKHKDLTKVFSVKSRDEIGRLSANLNEFLVHLKESMDCTKEASEKNIEARKSMMVSLEESSKSAVSINSSVVKISSLSSELKDSVIQSEEAVGNIISLIMDLQKQIDDETVMVEESSAAVNQIITSVKNMMVIIQKNKIAADELVSISHTGEKKLSKTTSVINQINESINEIKGIAFIIEDISDRINLLSMNAAIEAARAGDAGSGFSVVANEIRKLAEESNKNSKDINDSLNSIVGNIELADNSIIDTSDTIRSSNEQLKALSERISDLFSSVTELGEGGNEILEAMTNLQDISSKVLNSSISMNNSIEVVNGSITKVKDHSVLVQDDSFNISKQMEVILHTIEDVNSLGDKVQEYSEYLNLEVQKFKTNTD